MTLMSSLSNKSGCTTVLCPSNYCMKFLSPAVDLIPRLLFTFFNDKVTKNIFASNFTEACLLFTSLESS